MFNDVCKLDIILKPSEIHLLNYDEISGVYVLFIKREPMYVGRSDHLKNRLYSHLMRNSVSTSFIANEIDEIGIKFVNERFSGETDFLEMAFMMEYNPPLNIKRNKWILSRRLIKKHMKQCKGKARYGDGKERCNRIAHENGYCRIHGGNGITPRILATKEANEYVKNNIQLKLII